LTGTAEAGDVDVLRGLLEIARFHREHERFHATNAFETATQLRRDAGALKHLADRWSTTKSPAPGRDYSQPELRVSGCPDLNDWSALATRGILFMEGESEPAELTEMKRRLGDIAEDLQRYSRWLGEKMDVAWQREAVLLSPALVDLALPRHLVLMRTTVHGSQTGLVGRLVAAAHGALTARSHAPADVRSDILGTSRLLRTAAWLLDTAAARLAEQAAELSLSDPDWTAFVEGVERRLAAAAPDAQFGAGAPPDD
jgi:hypothetical protein